LSIHLTLTRKEPAMSTFKKATKATARLRLALVGPPGAGKTYTALTLAKHLGQRVALIDTERGSASKYADLFDFDALELESHSPAAYVTAIHAAEAAGYDVLVIDSLSHAWNGRGGALEMVDAIAARSKSGNSFTAWREVTPHHNALLDAILGAKCHVIATLRSKVEYAVDRDERTGKLAPRKIGLAPVQRDGLEYEFDVVGELDQENTLAVTKTRCPALSGKALRKPGKDLADVLSQWLGAGTPAAGRDMARLEERIAHKSTELNTKRITGPDQLRRDVLAWGQEQGLAGAIRDWPAARWQEIIDAVRGLESRYVADRGAYLAGGPSVNGVS
jgi:hypothetical protein